MRLFNILGFLSLAVFSMDSAQSFELLSNSMTTGEKMDISQVFNGFGCTGQNKSPDLFWKKVPEGTKSFALTMYDPDAPTGSGWWHWVMVNIPATETQLKAGAGSLKSKDTPKGVVQTQTDFGTKGYGGPCPPEKERHRYVFTLHALKVDKLDVKPGMSAAMVGFYIYQNTIDKTTFTAIYER